MEPYRFTAGATPLLVSIPHGGTAIPPELAARMTAAARSTPDTDWHMERLYDFLGDLDCSIIVATQSRYVIDLNRAPDGAPLYPGASETELCPTSRFDGEEIYLENQAPDAAEIAARRYAVWQPYHDKIAEELRVSRDRHGMALLWDAHSIRSEVPRFFEGKLPDLNLGTGGGASADPGLTGLLTAVAKDAGTLGYSHAVNGRFKGGYITRTHGDPAQGVQAVQLELSQATYMDEDPPFTFREDLADRVRPVLQGLLQSYLAWAELEATED